MGSLRKIFGFLMAGLMLAAFASPGMAQTKIFSLTMSYQTSATISGPVGSTTGPTYRAVYKNETPNGNSTINSVILTGPAGMVITNAQLQASYVQGNTNITGIGSNTIYISNMSGIKAGGATGYVDVQLSPSATVPPCSTWSAQAFAGNAFSQPFALLTNLSVLTVGTGTGCQIDLVMYPASVSQSSTGVSMTATFSNNGGAYSSLSLAAPTTIGLTIPSLPTLTLASGTTASVVWCGATGGPICVKNISPAIPTGSQLTVNLTVNVAPTCTTTLTGNWSAAAYAGTNLNGTVFTTDSASKLATAINAQACLLNFSPNPPQNGITGKPLPTFSVTEAGGTGSQDVTITTTTTGCSVSGDTVVAASLGTASFSNVIVSVDSTNTANPNTCTLTAASAGYPSVTSNSFTVFATGPIVCEPNGTYTFDFSPSGGNINKPGYFAGQRGAYNKDGSGCQQIGITATNSIVGSGSGQFVKFNWDTGIQPGAAFLYTITWNPEYVDMTTGGTGLPSRKTKVNWNGSTYASPVDGRACIAWNPTNVPTAPTPVHYLPFPYGTLASNIDGQVTTTSITLTGIGSVFPPNATANSLPPVPFAITIDSERMTVTDTSASPTWTVVRGAGNTSPALHSASKYVMSNPLPVADDGYQQRVCIAEEGWSIVPAGAPNCPVAPATGGATVPTSCALVTTTIYDVGDTIISRQ